MNQPGGTKTNKESTCQGDTTTELISRTPSVPHCLTGSPENSDFKKDVKP
jgi:hypothetical protein